MRILNAIQRIIMLLILIPVIFICLDTLLRAFNAQRSNAIVRGVRDIANTFIIEPFTTVFPDQNYLQNAAVALAAFGLLTLLVVFLFRGLRSMVGTRPPRAREQGAGGKTGSKTGGTTGSKSGSTAATSSAGANTTDSSAEAPADEDAQSPSS